MANSGKLRKHLDEREAQILSICQELSFRSDGASRPYDVNRYLEMLARIRVQAEKSDSEAILDYLCTELEAASTELERDLIKDVVQFLRKGRSTVDISHVQTFTHWRQKRREQAELDKATAELVAQRQAKQKQDREELATKLGINLDVLEKLREMR